MQKNIACRCVQGQLHPTYTDKILGFLDPSLPLNRNLNYLCKWTFEKTYLPPIFQLIKVDFE